MNITKQNTRRGALAVLLLSAACCLWPAQASAQQWTTNDNNISNANTGNVGIGTPSPEAKLNVLGDLLLGGTTDSAIGVFNFTVRASGFSINGGNGRGLMIKAGDSDNTAGRAGGNLWLNPGSPASPAVTFGNVFVATTGGNVGIGTTAPSAKVDVKGSFRSWADSQGDVTITHAGLVSTFNAAPTVQLALGANGNEAIRINTAGNIGIGTTAPGFKLDVLGSLNASGGLCIGGTCKSSWAEVGGTSQWANGGSSAISYNVGNVGIGTAAPAAKLDVMQANATAIRALSGSAGAHANIQLGRAAPEFSLGIAASPGHYATDSGAGDIIFRTEDPGRRLLFSNGPASSGLTLAGNKVGVGTATPGFKLDVAGSVNASGLCLAGTCKSSWSEIGTSHWAASGSNISYSAGNVGVGTTAPGFKLHVGGGSVGVQNSADDAIVSVFSGAPNEAGVFGWSKAAGLVYLQGGSWGGTTKNIVIQGGGGNVGIGYNTPFHKLHVYGTGGFGVQSAPGEDAVVQVHTGDLTQSGTFGWSTAGFAYLQAGQWGPGAKNMVIQAGGGNVSIGTGNPPNPAAKLHVQGNVHSSGDITADGSIAAKYQDVAEWVPSGQRLAAGTVVVLDVDKNNHVLASTSSYDTKVAGVVSAQPGLILGQGGEGKLMVATTGRVRVKADATSAPIKVGDLLVTSEVEGTAMRSEPVAVGGRKMHAPGTIIGKALEPLGKGVGEILVLLSLQ